MRGERQEARGERRCGMHGEKRRAALSRGKQCHRGSREARVTGQTRWVEEGEGDREREREGEAKEERELETPRRH